jgi:hypothetical protein
MRGQYNKCSSAGCSSVAPVQLLFLLFVKESIKQLLLSGVPATEHETFMLSSAKYPEKV